MSKRTFNSGNPATNTVGTIPGADWFNEVNNQRHDGLDVDGHGALDYAISTGTNTAYVLSLPKPLTAHIPGMPISWKAHVANGGAATINIDGMVAISLKRPDGSALKAGDIPSGAIVTMRFDGTYYQVTSCNSINVSDVTALFPSSLNTQAYTTSGGFKRIPDPNSPTGFIIHQWMSGTFMASGAQTLQASYPIVFPNCIMYIGACNNENLNNNDAPVQWRPNLTTLSQIGLYCANAIATNTGWSVFAIGY